MQCGLHLADPRGPHALLKQRVHLVRASQLPRKHNVNNSGLSRGMSRHNMTSLYYAYLERGVVVEVCESHRQGQLVHKVPNIVILHTT